MKNNNFKNIPFGSPVFDKKTYSLIKKVIDSKKLVHGPMIVEFEKKFSILTKSKFCLGVSSCTMGMHMIYYHLGIQKGDEVIVPAQTHVATAMAVEAVGAKPIFIDSNYENGNINLFEIESKITNKTKAISVVHYLGFPVDMKPIMRIAKKYKLFVLEDCALSLGSKYENIHTGLIGDAGVFSFYPVKHITTSEGGMIITKHKKLYKSLKLLRGFGVDKDYDKRKIPGQYNTLTKGLNGRMSEIEAAMGISQLNNFNFFLKRRSNNYTFLQNKFQKLKNISSLNTNVNYKFFWSPYCYALILNKKLIKYRNKIMLSLNNQGVGTSIYYPKPVPCMKYFKNKYKIKSKFNNAMRFSNNAVMLPIAQHVSKKDISYIASKVEDVIKKFS